MIVTVQKTIKSSTRGLYFYCTPLWDNNNEVIAKAIEFIGWINDIKKVPTRHRDALRRAHHIALIRITISHPHPLETEVWMDDQTFKNNFSGMFELF